MANRPTLPQGGITEEEWDQFHDLWEKIRPLYTTIYSLKRQLSDNYYTSSKHAVYISSNKHQTGPNTSLTSPVLHVDPYDGTTEIEFDEECQVLFMDLEFPAETEMRLKRKIEDKNRERAEKDKEWRRRNYEAMKREFEPDAGR